MTDTREDIDYGQVTESLNDKLDRDLSNSIVPMDFVVSTQAPTAENNYTWYRLYKSGWVEQGGVIPSGTTTPSSIILPLEMKDANYTVQISVQDSSPEDNQLTIASYNNRTKTGFTVYRSYNGTTQPSCLACWQISGYCNNSIEDEESGETVYGNTYKIYKGVYPDWTNGQTLLNDVYPSSTSPSTITIQNDGFIRLYASKDPSGNTLHISINDFIVGSYPAFSSSFANNMYPVFKNDVIKLTTDSTVATWRCWLYYYPSKDVDAEMNLADDSEVVHLEGDETIDGTKTFTKPLIISTEENDNRIITKLNNITIGTLPNTTQYVGHTTQDSTENFFASCNCSYTTDGKLGYNFWVKRNDSGDNVSGTLGIYIDQNGANAYTVAPTPTSTTDNSTKIATTEHLMNVLKAIYPVGSVYIGTQTTCPMSAFFGTWELVSSGKALWTGSGNNGNTTIDAGLPGHTHYENWIFSEGIRPVSANLNHNQDGGQIKSIKSNLEHWSDGNQDVSPKGTMLYTGGASNSIYGKSSTVQPPAYVVNVWRRTA